MSNHTLKDPCELLESMVETFQPEADIAIIEDVRRQHQATEKIQTHEHDAVHKQLKSLSRELELAKARTIRPVAALTEEEHANQMVQLDRQKFLLAKEIQDYEQEGRDLEVQLQQAKEELKKLESQMNVITPETDGIALVLKMYRELGVEPIIDDSGQISHIQVQSSNGYDVHKLPLDSDESQFNYANRIWEMCS